MIKTLLWIALLLIVLSAGIFTGFFSGGINLLTNFNSEFVSFFPLEVRFFFYGIGLVIMFLFYKSLSK